MNAIYLSLLFLILCSPGELSAAAKTVTLGEFLAGSTSTAMPRYISSTAASHQEHAATTENNYFLFDALLIHCNLATHETLERYKEQFRTTWWTITPGQRSKMKNDLKHKQLLDILAQAHMLTSRYSASWRHLTIENELKNWLTKTSEVAWPTEQLSTFETSIQELHQHIQHHQEAFEKYEHCNALQMEAIITQKRKDGVRTETDLACQQLQQEYTRELARFNKEKDALQNKTEALSIERNTFLAHFVEDVLARVKGQAAIELCPLPVLGKKFNLDTFFL